MRNFIVSDLHGNENAYNSIIKFLENVNKDDELTLYINGDLIDRGEGSGYMLTDVIDRIKNKKGFNIKYLAGNHELMMYQTSKQRKNGKWPDISNWYVQNGGLITLEEINKLPVEKVEEIIEFISKLDIYYKFKEKISGKNIVLVHSKCPKKVKDICDIKIEDDNKKVYEALWTRCDNLDFIKQKLGNRKYFTIIGHTPVLNERGYRYNSRYNYMNIDGGCAKYVQGDFDYNHIPLVEIEEDENRLKILTFNNKNEIILGNYFIEGLNVKMEFNTLEKNRKYVDKSVKIKMLRP